MGKQFMSGTPLAGLEREMTQPGRMVLPTESKPGICRLRYSAADEVCRRCKNTQRENSACRPCPAESRQGKEEVWT